MNEKKSRPAGKKVIRREWMEPVGIESIPWMRSDGTIANPALRESYIRTVIALTLVERVGRVRIRRLLLGMKEPARLFRMKSSQLRGELGLNEETAARISHFKSWDLVDRLTEKWAKSGIVLAVPGDFCYPDRLRHIGSPPPLIFIRGEAKALRRPFLAVVGTRRPTRPGLDVTKRLTRGLVRKADIGIASGMATGVDACAHKAALEEGAVTVAVLGSGVEAIYPASNTRLAGHILESGGALVSEYLPDAKPETYHFPERNRIISGISLGVLVTETGLKGGSRITIDFGLEQGREIFIVPHDLSNRYGQGCNMFIQQGYGKIITTTEDILEELPFVNPGARCACIRSDPQDAREAKQGGTSVQQRRSMPKLSPLQRAICRTLRGGPRHVDDIRIELKLAVSTLMASLLVLELQGVVSQLPGKNFTLR